MNADFPFHKTILTFLLFSLSFTQTLNVQGKVFTQNNEPISDVNIYTEYIGSTSQSDGSFSLLVDANSTVTFSHIGYTDVSMLASEISDIIQLNTIELSVPAIIVRGGLRNISLLNSAPSISIIDESTLRNESSPHFQGLIQTIPNLNWAGGTSRPRYFQIRGIGERSLYATEGAPNFSVGFVIDDIDFSGIGMPAMLLDMNQIEIFRGPQSSIYGANAMAGLISMHSNDPTHNFEFKVNTSISTDNRKNLGIVLNSPIVENLNTRFTVYSGNEDGFRTNKFLNTTNSNGKSETLIRSKTLWTPTNNIQVELTSLYSDQDNKYDVWAPDNNVALNTYSDKEGKDSQQSQAYSLRGQFQNILGGELTSITTYSKNESEHSYDGDWGNDDFWSQTPYNIDGWAYDYYDQTIRNRNTITQELRLAKNLDENTSIITGIYTKSLTEKDDAIGYLFSGDASTFESSFDVNNMAVYLQFEHAINSKLTTSLNTRMEQNKISYLGVGDNYGTEIPNVNIDVEHVFLGFKSSIIYNQTETSMAYASLSRGYKAGGVNQNPYLSLSNRLYNPEFNWNYEMGYKCFSSKSQLQFTGFYMSRENQQVNISSQQDETDPTSFNFYTANATAGYNMGTEFDVSYHVNEKLSLNMNMGYLQTHVNKYEYNTAETTSITLGNREQAQAPKYTYAIGFNYNLPFQLALGVDVSGKDKFYFSDSHNMMSEAYQILNMNVSYTCKNIAVNLWGKNIFDERYAIRGFYFGLEPPTYEKTLYLQWGDPIEYGLSLQYSF